MFTRSLRTAMKRDEGQALVLACLVMLILSIAVLTTVNLGHSVHERVRLQNTADAAAYSMAAMEARAFNFYAFANRTQVSHYVSAMSWQSLLSFAYFVEAFVVDVYGVMKTLDKCANPSSYWTVICPLLTAVPVVGNLINFISTAIGWFRTFIKYFVLLPLRTADPDHWVGRYVIPLYRVMNEVLAGASRATFLATLTHVTSTSSDVVMANDPDVDSRNSQLVAGLLSACILNRAHMKEALNPFSGPLTLPVEPTRDDQKVSRAKRVMGNISNATRFACDRAGGSTWCGPGWVTSRDVEDVVPLPSGLQPVRDLLKFLPQWKWGQTKMLTFRDARGRNPPEANLIRDWHDAPNAPVAMLAQGDAIGADDLYHFGLGPRSFDLGPLSISNPFNCRQTDDPLACWGDNRKDLGDTIERKLPFRAMLKTSIWALPKADAPSIHWRLVTSRGGTLFPTGPGAAAPNGGWSNNEADIGLGKNAHDYKLGPVTIFSIAVWAANVRGVEDGNHPWEGLAAFPHFEPGQYAGACGDGLQLTGTPSAGTAASRQQEYNQPSTWVLLNKTPEQMKNERDTTGAGNNKPALLNAHGTVSLDFDGRGTKLAMDNTRKTFLAGQGLNVISRGQAYYHRPGNWAEQPNFFNPYWKPRLGAVMQGLYSMPLVDGFTRNLPGPVRGLPQKVVTH